MCDNLKYIIAPQKESAIREASERAAWTSRGSLPFGNVCCHKSGQDYFLLLVVTSPVCTPKSCEYRVKDEWRAESIAIWLPCVFDILTHGGLCARRLSAKMSHMSCALTLLHICSEHCWKLNLYIWMFYIQLRRKLN